MPGYTKPSLREVLKRWQQLRVIAIDTEHSVSLGGLHGAHLEVTTEVGQATLVVTAVRAEAGATEVDVVEEALNQLVHAPGDAAFFAAEVERLLRRIADMKGLA